MQSDAAFDGGWLVVTLRGHAAEASDADWVELRQGIPWGRATKAICDVTDVLGASDRAVETLLGMTADAHHHGGKLIIVGMSGELYARFGAMGVVRYVALATTVAEARANLDLLL